MVICIGLNGSGKTSILYNMICDDHVTHTMPTVGFNVETIQTHGIGLQIWDLSGDTSCREYWIHHMEFMHALIYVVDASDHHRLSLSAQYLHHLLEHPKVIHTTIPCLIFLNKVDQPKTLCIDAIEKEFDIHRIRMRRRIQVFTCEAIHKKGLQNGFLWLTNQL